MAYTWQQFKDAVKVFLTVDKDRIGIGEPDGFNDMMLRQAVLEVQSLIPFYTVGHQDTYSASDFTPIQAVSKLTLLPEGVSIVDAYVIRKKDPTSNLTGSTNANAATSITGSGTKFTTQLAIGDKISLGGGAYVMVTAIQSDTSLTVLTPAGNGSATQSIRKLVINRYPVIDTDWKKHQELFSGQVCLNDRQAYSTMSPQGDYYIYPAVQALDLDGEQDQVELNWNGLKLDFEDGDVTPFDEQMTLVVADYVKGKIELQVNHDLQQWGVYLLPIAGSGEGGGTFWRGIRRLYLKRK